MEDEERPEEEAERNDEAIKTKSETGKIDQKKQRGKDGRIFVSFHMQINYIQ